MNYNNYANLRKQSYKMMKNVKGTYFFIVQRKFSEYFTTISELFPIFVVLIHFNRFRLVFKRLKGAPSRVVRQRMGNYVFCATLQ